MQKWAIGKLSQNWRLQQKHINRTHLQHTKWRKSLLTFSFNTDTAEVVPGYVCNPGSPRERDAASKR